MLRIVRKVRNGKPIIVVAIAVIVICSIIALAGNSHMSFASSVWRNFFGVGQSGNPYIEAVAVARYQRARSMYHLPGERMRQNARTGIAIGVGLLIWGTILTYKAEKDTNSKDLL